MDITKQFNLTLKQKEAIEYIIQGKNILLTGPSGVGKSLVIKIFREYYGNCKKIAVTSTTGISALLIGGTTLHSYLGIGLGRDSAENLTNKINKKAMFKKRWKTLEVLIIDEISMLSPELFDKLEYIARNIRKTNISFGGIQLILVGDFLQLPVVGSDNFCFEAKSWDKCIDHTIHLTEIIRQDNKHFQNVLNDLRIGNVSEEAKKLLLSRINIKLENNLGILPTKIYTTNADVDQINQQELDKLTSDLYEYDMQIEFYISVKDQESAFEKFRKSCLAPDKLQLCIGAQVMLLCNLNMEYGLANGSRGAVIGFSENDLPIVKFLNGQESIIDFYEWVIEEGDQEQIGITQIPLKLAYAITVHKSQGMTLDYAEINLNSLFTYGQAYVALSRIRNEKGMSISGINFKEIKAHPKALKFYGF